MPRRDAADLADCAVAGLLYPGNPCPPPAVAVVTFLARQMADEAVGPCRPPEDSGVSEHRPASRYLETADPGPTAASIVPIVAQPALLARLGGYSMRDAGNNIPGLVGVTLLPLEQLVKGDSLLQHRHEVPTF